MTDPVQTTQQTSAVVDSAGGPGGIIGAVLGALTVLGGLWRVIFGSRKERTDASERAAEIALRAAEHAENHAERADEQSAVYKRERLTCEEQLSEMRAEIRLMRADEALCRAVLELAGHTPVSLTEEEVAAARRALDLLSGSNRRGEK